MATKKAMVFPAGRALVRLAPKRIVFLVISRDWREAHFSTADNFETLGGGSAVS